MFDIGWSEMLIIALLTLIIIGPREIPNVLRTVSNAMRKIQELGREFRSGLEEMARESGLDKTYTELNQLRSMDFNTEANQMIDPDHSLRGEIESLQDDLDPTSGSSLHNTMQELDSLTAKNRTGQTSPSLTKTAAKARVKIKKDTSKKDSRAKTGTAASPSLRKDRNVSGQKNRKPKAAAPGKRPADKRRGETE